MYDTDRFREEERRREVYRARDAALQMSETRGWADMSAWLEQEVEVERNRLERGVPDWDEYQRTVGRLEVLRKVLGRPAELVAEAEQHYDTGE